MEVLNHLIYEYHKGLRQLALHTFSKEKREAVVHKLEQQKIPFLMQEVNERKYNVFLGDTTCLRIVELMSSKRLNEYSPEEDFILGIMLGYDRCQQCQRYLSNHRKTTEKVLHNVKEEYRTLFQPTLLKASRIVSF